MKGHSSLLEKYPNACSNVEFYCDGKCVSINHRCDEHPYCCKYTITNH